MMTLQSQDFQKLKDTYRSKLEPMLADLIDMLTELKSSDDKVLISDILSTLHKLKGSTAIYGYLTLSHLLVELEIFIKTIFMTNYCLETQDQLRHFMSRLKNKKICVEDVDVFSIVDFEEYHANMKIYFFDDTVYSEEFIKIFEDTQYQLFFFKNEDEFIQATKEALPAAAYINLNLIQSNLKAFLNETKFKSSSSITLINFITDREDYTERLQAIRMNGSGFYIKPLNPDIILNKILQHNEVLFKKYKILIIDDDIEVCAYYKLILKKAGMEVYVVNNIKELDTAFFSFLPDLALVDIKMPGCNGDEVAKILRQNELLEAMPIIYISGIENSDKELQAISPQSDGFISKFLSAADIIYMIRAKSFRYEYLRRLMIKDSLTHVFNRLYMMQTLSQEFFKAAREKQTFSVAMIDLDLFKKINDRFGHLCGDQILKDFCIFLETHIRKSDILGRIGGEEFLIIFPNSSSENVVHALEKIKIKYSELKQMLCDESVSLTFSAGVADSAHFDNVHSILAAADKGMYKAKKMGRDTVFAWDASF